MQADKFYKAQEIRKEIFDLQAILNTLDKPFEAKIFDKLNIETQKLLNSRVTEIVTKELTKIIKQKEKEFVEL